MKWFKHMVNTIHDEKIADLIDQCGIEGYGYFWRVLEIIADQMDKTDKCEVTYSLPQWSRLLYSHHHKVGNMLGKLGVTGLMIVSNIEGKIRVMSPNLLKYRDEYSKKSRQTPDKLRTMSGLRTETETEGDTETEQKQTKETAIAVKKDPIPSQATTSNPTPKKRRVELTDEQWIVSLSNNHGYSHIDVQAEHYKAQEWCNVNRRQCTRRFFVKWLNRIEKPMNGSLFKKPERESYATATEEQYQMMCDAFGGPENVPVVYELD